MAEFNDRRTNVIKVNFGGAGEACVTCRGYGRTKGPTRSGPGGSQVTPTKRCTACGGSGTR